MKLFTIFLFVIGLAVMLFGMVPPFLNEMMIYNTVGQLNSGQSIEEIKPVISHILNGNKVTLVPGWLSMLSSITGLLIMYISTVLFLKGSGYFKQMLSIAYWTKYNA